MSLVEKCQLKACTASFGTAQALDRVFWANDQVFGGVLARRGLAPLYERNGWPFPPLQPEFAPTDATADHQTVLDARKTQHGLITMRPQGDRVVRPR